MKIQPVTGWVLLVRAEDNDEKSTGHWHIAWLDVFGTKRAAIEFAKENGWPGPYKAVRGELTAHM